MQFLMLLYPRSVISSKTSDVFWETLSPQRRVLCAVMCTEHQLRTALLGEGNAFNFELDNSNKKRASCDFISLLRTLSSTRSSQHTKHFVCGLDLRQLLKYVLGNIGYPLYQLFLFKSFQRVQSNKALLPSFPGWTGSAVWLVVSVSPYCFFQELLFLLHLCWVNPFSPSPPLLCSSDHQSVLAKDAGVAEWTHSLLELCPGLVSHPWCHWLLHLQSFFFCLYGEPDLGAAGLSWSECHNSAALPHEHRDVPGHENQVSPGELE